MFVAQRIGTLVIGKNDGWKQMTSLGKRTNQNLVFVPHARFIEMLRYTAELVGIQVQITEESYTSRASFLDGDPLPVYDSASPAPVFISGRRLKRGQYRAADVNGAYNIMRKGVPNAFGNVIGGVVVHPRQDRPDEWAIWPRCPYCLELYMYNCALLTLVRRERIVLLSRCP